MFKEWRLGAIKNRF